MTHSTEFKRTIVPRDRVRVRTDPPPPTGNARTYAGAPTPRASAPCRGHCGIGRAQMRRRAIVAGGDS
jgi:hypothetical protein